MGLIDADNLKKAIDRNPNIRFIKSGQVVGTWVNVRDCIKVIDRAPNIDPIHYAGGCYCRECEKNEKGHCLIMRGCSVAQMGFCGYGRRREGGE